MDDFFTSRKNPVSFAGANSQCNFDFPTTYYLTKARLNITQRGVVLSRKDILYQSHIKKAQNKAPVRRWIASTTVSLLFPVDQQKSRLEDLHGTLVPNLNVGKNIAIW